MMIIAMMPEFDDNITRWTTYGWAITIKKKIILPDPSLTMILTKIVTHYQARHRNILPEADPDITYRKRSLTPSSARMPSHFELARATAGGYLVVPARSVTLGGVSGGVRGVRTAAMEPMDIVMQLGVRGAEGRPARLSRRLSRPGCGAATFAWVDGAIQGSEIFRRQLLLG